MRPQEFDRGQVLDRAMKVFWQRGYTGTSVQDLVDATGLGRSSLYNAFGSKRELYEEALRRYQELRAAEMALLFEEGSYKERVRRLLMTYVEEELQDDQGLGCMITKAAVEFSGRDEQIGLMVMQNLHSLEMSLYALFNQAQQRGEMAADKDVRALARFVLNAIQGLRVLSKGFSEKERRQLLIDVVETTIAAL